MVPSHAVAQKLEEEYKKISHRKVQDNQEDANLIPITILLNPTITPTTHLKFHLETHLMTKHILLREILEE